MNMKVFIAVLRGRAAAANPQNDRFLPESLRELPGLSIHSSCSQVGEKGRSAGRKAHRQSPASPSYRCHSTMRRGSRRLLLCPINPIACQLMRTRDVCSRGLWMQPPNPTIWWPWSQQGSDCLSYLEVKDSYTARPPTKALSAPNHSYSEQDRALHGYTELLLFPESRVGRIFQTYVMYCKKRAAFECGAALERLLAKHRIRRLANSGDGVIR
ncbi:hypothetical protein C7410_1652 [Paraburkholderia silvatlantica]|uniref:Uncharacterized protein n=1 Tax=Paraburkholderia silvatlantica TaxID=321895 RepID=A0A2V4SWL9_9BURK|nr:hypothetical protein C7410_1652 [Paraburkholderia silvatlantica]TDQ89370.1 hypothetical protein C7412_1153 [Paraburkholderia silvatlantica]